MKAIEARKLWTNALRSGDYKQAKGYLHCKTGDIDSFCCLGVACEVYRTQGGELTLDERAGYCTYDGAACVLPEKVAKWLDITVGGQLETKLKGSQDILSLINANDGEGYSFEQIAEIVESGNLKSNSLVASE